MFHSLKKSIICIAGIFSFAITSQVWAEDFSVTYVDYSGSNCPADVVDIVKAQGLKFKFSTVDYQKMRLLSAETKGVRTPSAALSNEGIADMYAYILPGQSTLMIGDNQYVLQQLYIMSDKTTPSNWQSGFYLNADKSCLVATNIESKD